MAIIQASVDKLDLSKVGSKGTLSSPYKLSHIIDNDFQPIFTDGDFGPYASVELTQKGITHTAFVSAPKGTDVDESNAFTLVAGIAPKEYAFKINNKNIKVAKGQIKFFLKPVGFTIPK